MRQSCQRVCRACSVCQRAKDSAWATPGLLGPFPIPNCRFGLYFIWITALPSCGPMGYNSVSIVVNRTTQQVRILPCVFGAGEMLSEATTKLLFEAVVRFYGLPDEALHDRDPCFTTDFCRDLWKLLESRAVFSSAYHP